jgi:hypothetical protein
MLGRTVLGAAALLLLSQAAAAQNSRPKFTSPTTASVSENLTAAAYQAAATDADNDPLSYFIAWGVDAGRFTIDRTSGALSFRLPPNFEAPSDGNADNEYRLTLMVADRRGGFAFRAVRITVTNLVEGFKVRRRGVGFSLPLFVTGSGDGSGRLFVVEKGGFIRILNPETGRSARRRFSMSAA